MIEKASLNGERLSDKRIKILQLMEEDPYISKIDLGKVLGLHPSSVWRNIEAMRGKYLRRVGPDNGGFWEILEWLPQIVIHTPSKHKAIIPNQWLRLDWFGNPKSVIRACGISEF